MAEQLALEQPRRNRRTIQLYKGVRLPGTKIVQRSSDQLFSGAGLSINEHGGIGGRHNLDFLQDVAKGFAISDNLFEVKFAANLGLEIDIFLGELILEFGNLPIRERIFNGQS